MSSSCARVGGGCGRKPPMTGDGGVRGSSSGWRSFRWGKVGREGLFGGVDDGLEGGRVEAGGVGGDPGGYALGA
jgi:hypothetical protein